MSADKMRDALQSWPERIYLQCENEHGDGVEPYPAAGEITWCADSIGRHDIQYVRADTQAAEIARLTRAAQSDSMMAECMCLVRQELIEGGIVDKTVPPMMVSNAVFAHVARLTQELAAAKAARPNQCDLTVYAPTHYSNGTAAPVQAQGVTLSLIDGLGGADSETYGNESLQAACENGYQQCKKHIRALLAQAPASDALKLAISEDTQRLNWLIVTEASIAWNAESTMCRVFHFDDGDYQPIMGWVDSAWSRNPREAIDAAIAALKEQK